jgi:eukaryotic-like serine/threonine-protein kinase
MDPILLPESVPLGPFRIQALLGQGSMGTVWRGVHVEQDVTVAIKVLRRELAERADSLQAFRDAVRRVAQCSHPGVLMLFDYGEMPGEAAIRCRGQIGSRIDDPHMDPDNPYVVMEFCEGGALARHPVTGWDEIRALLLMLLDALAHAHARDVVHGAIRPPNILLARGEAGPQYKLTDFGIERRRGPAGVAGFMVASNPAFLAPEQVGGVGRIGPATDLYALGRVAWWLVTGQQPGAETELPAGMDLPDGFARWLDRMLHRHPERRFPAAADAAHVLSSVGGGAPLENAASFEAGMTTLHIDVGDLRTHLLGDADDGGVGAVLTGLGASRIRAEDIAPVPPSCCRKDLQPTPMELVGTGLGLYEWKTVPVIGRELQRDRIWTQLLEVENRRQPRLVMLSGEAGYGKSRLAEWMAQRALEVGAVGEYLRVEHNRIPGPTHGLVGLVARHLDCLGRDDATVRANIERHLVRHANGGDVSYERVALTELLTATRDSVRGVGTPEERYGLVLRFLGRLCRERPLLLVLEDVHQGADSLAFARFVLERLETPVPVLMLATLRSDLLDERSLERDIARELRAMACTDALEVGPLSTAHGLELVQQLLRLEKGLAREVVKRSGGNPMFALLIVGDWVRRGLLKVGAEGFVLPDGAEARIPSQIHHLWQGRLGSVLQRQPAQAELCLQVAAALGREVDRREWEAGCARLDADIPPRLLEALLAQRLAEPRERGWAFRHGMMRESLEQRSELKGTWNPVNLACADMLKVFPPVRRLDERIGRHLLAAGRLPEAFERLLLAAEKYLDSSDTREAGDLLERCEGNLRRLAVPGGDERWGELWMRQVRLRTTTGDPGGARTLLDRAIAAAAEHGWTRVHARAQRHLGRLTARDGDLEGGRRRLEEAVVEFRDAGSTRQQARCQLDLATITRKQGDLDGALRSARLAAELGRACGDRRTVGQSIAETGNVLALRGQIEDGARHIRESSQLFEEIGYTQGVASCHSSLAEVARLREDPATADREYAAAEKLLERIGSPQVAGPLVQRAMLALQRGNTPRAHRMFERALTIVQRQDMPGIETPVHAGLLACAADAWDWGGVDEHLDVLENSALGVGEAQADIALASQRAGKLLLRGRQHALAARALRVAVRAWEASGDPERAAEVKTVLEGVRPPSA